MPANSLKTLTDCPASHGFVFSGSTKKGVCVWALMWAEMWAAKRPSAMPTPNCESAIIDARKVRINFSAIGPSRYFGGENKPQRVRRRAFTAGRLAFGAGQKV
ncbi:MAG: hypothetical protein ACKOFM_01140, partial [Actinomycetota bacterium]